MKPIYRSELKYFINYEHYILLRERLKHIFKPDMVANREYNVRSLYFDDYYKSSESEKYAGSVYRKKYRIRCYNGMDQTIKLEKKVKREAYVHKEVQLITKDIYESLANRQISHMEIKGEGLLNEWLYLMKNKGLSPRVIVDYNREAYVLPEGDVRITFDKGLSVANPKENLFNETLLTRPVLHSKQMILEVKFTGFLPSILREVLQIGSLEQTSLSKYIMCIEKNKNLGGILNV